MIAGNAGIFIAAKGILDNNFTDRMLISEKKETMGVNIKRPVIRNKKHDATESGISVNPMSGAMNRFEIGDITEK